MEKKQEIQKVIGVQDIFKKRRRDSGSDWSTENCSRRREIQAMIGSEEKFSKREERRESRGDWNAENVSKRKGDNQEVYWGAGN